MDLEALFSGIVGGGVVVAVGGFWVKNFFAPYVVRKAQLHAEYENLKNTIETLRHTENVRATAMLRLWEKQTNWTMKRDLYVRVMEAAENAQLWTIRIMEWERDQNDVLRKKRPELFDDAVNKWREAYQNFLVAKKLIPILMPDRAETLESYVLFDVPPDPSNLEFMLTDVRRTMLGVIEAARGDLHEQH